MEDSSVQYCLEWHVNYVQVATYLAMISLNNGCSLFLHAAWRKWVTEFSLFMKHPLQQRQDLLGRKDGPSKI
jgi:hypothetical protein